MSRVRRADDRPRLWRRRLRRADLVGEPEPGSSTFDDVFDRRRPAEDESRGSQISGTVGESSRECPMCGFENDRRAGFCLGCGEPLAVRKFAGKFIDVRSFRYAGFWLRAFAILVDTFILLAPTLAVCFVVYFVQLDRRNPPPGFFEWLVDGAAEFEWAIDIVFFLLYWPYYAIFESSVHQATPGKMTAGIIVTDMRGRRLSFGRATGRYFGKFISNMCCSLGYLWAAFSDRKQAWHDLMADCLVLRKETP